MNLLDENVREDQRGLLQSWGIPIRQIGVDVGQKGIKDNEIITLLHKLRDTTFFTRDLGFYSRDVCHARDCIICLAVEKDEVAVFVRRFLRHPEFDEKSKRMGSVLRASHTRLTVWRKNVPKEIEIGW